MATPMVPAELGCTSCADANERRIRAGTLRALQPVLIVTGEMGEPVLASDAAQPASIRVALQHAPGGSYASYLWRSITTHPLWQQFWPAANTHPALTSDDAATLTTAVLLADSSHIPPPAATTAAAGVALVADGVATEKSTRSPLAEDAHSETGEAADAIMTETEAPAVAPGGATSGATALPASAQSAAVAASAATAAVEMTANVIDVGSVVWTKWRDFPHWPAEVISISKAGNFKVHAFGDNFINTVEASQVTPFPGEHFAARVADGQDELSLAKCNAARDNSQSNKEKLAALEKFAEGVRIAEARLTMAVPADCAGLEAPAAPVLLPLAPTQLHVHSPPLLTFETDADRLADVAALVGTLATCAAHAHNMVSKMQDSAAASPDDPHQELQLQLHSAADTAFTTLAGVLDVLRPAQEQVAGHVQQLQRQLLAARKRRRTEEGTDGPTSQELKRLTTTGAGYKMAHMVVDARRRPRPDSDISRRQAIAARRAQLLQSDKA